MRVEPGVPMGPPTPGTATGYTGVLEGVSLSVTIVEVMTTRGQEGSVVSREADRVALGDSRPLRLEGELSNHP